MSIPYLILVLQAPLIAYGKEAVDSIRPTDHMPGRSMLTGLLGNAIGYRRKDADQLAQLQACIRYAARTEHSVQMNASVRDFHTAQLGARDAAWTTYGVPERRAGGPGLTRAPEIRDVHYLAETRSVVALSLAESGLGLTLPDVAQALRMPARPLFVGRKCCLPERPVLEGKVSAENDTEALHMVELGPDVKQSRVQWDGSEHHESVRKTHELWVSDLKDWRNGVHVGRRMVNRGVVVLSDQDVNEPGE